MAISQGRPLAVALVCALALAGCESARFVGRGPSAAAARSAGPIVSAPEPTVSTVPSGSVTAEPLPPPPGAGDPSTTTIAGLDVPAAVPVMPGSPAPIETLGSAPAGAAASPGSSRSASVGGWTVREASGTCRITLSSTPALDLYRASAGACANRDLARVTGWDFRDGEIYLYQPGGAVAARLRGSGGTLSGVLAKSGAPLTLTR